MVQQHLLKLLIMAFVLISAFSAVSVQGGTVKIPCVHKSTPPLSNYIFACMRVLSFLFSLLQMIRQTNYPVYPEGLGRITVYHTTIGAVF
jgi:hypothetical protein